jgi:hypothetical protein
MLLAAPVARADDLVSTNDTAHPEHTTPAFAASRAGAIVDLWPAKDNFSTVFGAELQLRVARQAFLDFGYTGAFASIHDSLFDNGNFLAFGNPTIGAHFVGAAGPGFHFFLGGGLTMPALQEPSTSVSNAAFYGTRMEGYYNADRFVRGHMAVRAAGGFEWHPGGAFYLRGEVRPVMYVPTNDRYPVLADTRVDFPIGRKGESQFMLEHAFEAELRSHVGLGIGGRIQGVWMPQNDDMAQLVAEPFVGMQPRRAGLYARVGVPLALDRDLGPAGERNKLIGVKINLGGQW